MGVVKITIDPALMPDLGDRLLSLQIIHATDRKTAAHPRKFPAPPPCVTGVITYESVYLSPSRLAIAGKQYSTRLFRRKTLGAPLDQGASPTRYS